MKKGNAKPNKDMPGQLEPGVISFVIGSYYLQMPNKHGIKQSENPLMYVGTKRYLGETHYEFFDNATRLLHWCDPENMKEAK